MIDNLRYVGVYMCGYQGVGEFYQFYLWVKVIRENIGMRFFDLFERVFRGIFLVNKWVSIQRFRKNYVC